MGKIMLNDIEYGSGGAIDMTARNQISNVNSDLQTSKTSLQNQIDEIVAPEGDPSLTEVANARVDAEGTTHTTLKERCDADAEKVSDLKSAINGGSGRENITLTWEIGGLTNDGELSPNTLNRIISSFFQTTDDTFSVTFSSNLIKVRVAYYTAPTSTASNFVEYGEWLETPGTYSINSGYYVRFLAGWKSNLTTDILNVGDEISASHVVPIIGLTNRVGVLENKVDVLENRVDVLENKNRFFDGLTVAVIGDSISTNGTEEIGTDLNAVELTVETEDVGKSLYAYVTHMDVYNNGVNRNTSYGGHTLTYNDIGTQLTFTALAEDVGKTLGKAKNYNPNTRTVWWEVVKDTLGGNYIPVCWSGSSITSHEGNTDMYKTSYAWHDAQIRKCGVRTPGTMDRTAPDIVIIYRGTNDFSHEPYTKLTENYFEGVNWEYPINDTVMGGYGYLEGLALTIKKLREAYPETQIYLCTLNVFKRINYSHFPTNNGLNTLPEYNNAIRKAADFFGCGLIEFDKDGITFENCYSGGYITDSATIPTHPSDKGHAVMGRKAIVDITAQFNEL